MHKKKPDEKQILELKKSKEKFQKLFESAYEAIFLMEGENFIDCNNRTLEIYGCKKKSDIVGHTPIEFSPPTQPDGKKSSVKALTYIKAALAGKSQEFYWKHSKKNGDLFDARVSLKKLNFGDEKKYIQAIVLDITEEKIVEKKLKETVSLLESILESTNNGILVIDKEGVVLKANKEFVKMWGIPAKLLKQGEDKKLLNFVLNQLSDPDMFISKVKELYKKPKEKSLDYLSFKDGRIFERISRPMLVDGEPVARVWSFRDFTKRKKIEAKLSESELKFRTIVENAPAIIFLLDNDGNFLLSEGKGLASLDLKPGEVIGSSAFEIYKDYPEVVAGVKKALAGKLYEGIVLIQGVYFNIFFSPYRDQSNKKNKVIGMAVDITKEEKAKEELKIFNKLKTEFMNIASHQLRSPLGSMRWNLEEIIESQKNNKNSQCLSKVKDVYDANLRVIDLVNDLLNVSRIEQSRVKSSIAKINIITIIEKIIEELEPQITNQKIKLNFIYQDEKKYEIRVDKNLFREAIQNLIVNAIKYNKKNGYILISLKKTRDKFNLVVANTGLFIKEKDKPRVFDKFFRSTEAIKSATEGTGLGLFVTKSYIEKWGGSIDFVSPAFFGEKTLNSKKLKGTFFKVDLPLKFKKYKQSMTADKKEKDE